ncbi:oligopeptide ABC transporter substrate-binding protein [Oceanobacillus halophilus]|uniref:Oligopeptide ABC transporter substrate-binding protein n=1 Tax=Oceanobacillus halophilus TaxID=930130 RepID=A0A495A8F2_9BACI|nr:oligopeptide ABC transporter substrate-binding protein [Oceanobacillus halophilus]RKQ35661.1 oligopeptide ABC transporter substrate-binding protein [Oceanobacillus halophilus]
MEKGKFSKWLLFIMLVSLLVLAACSSGSDEETEGTDEPDATEEEGTEEAEESEEESEEESSEDGLYSIEDFGRDKTNEGEAIDGGTLQYGLVTDTPFEGTLNYNFYSGTPDAEIIKFFDESLLAVDNNFNYTQEGAATFDVSEDGKTFTLTIKDNVNWHDGEPVKAEDWLFSYEVIGHPDYDGVRYDATFQNIVGMEEYHAGEADTISGIEVVDEKTLTITYKEANPSLLASGIWTYAMPKHVFEGIEVADMAASDEVRKNPIGMGPFKVESIVPGESVTFVANEDYYQGTPKLDGLTLKVIPPTTVAQALETGEVDMVDSFPTDQFPDVEESLTNVEWLGQTDLAYTYIGFKLGKWDADAGEVVMDPDAKMADVNLRRAMWYAVDNDSVGEQFYNGLRWAGTTLIIPAFPDYHDPTIEAPSYDLDEANRILDEAGYEDTDGDGIRENPEGEELVINFASMSGGDTAEPIANYYMQAWEQVGLKVELVDGRLLEFNSFYDRIEADDPGIDIYQGAWGTGSDVDQQGLYGRHAMFNYPRYASEENDRLLQEGASEKSLDTDYRKEVYKEWQQLMVDDIPVFPTLYRAALVPVNNRVTDYSIQWQWDDWHEVGLTQEEPLLP